MLSVTTTLIGVWKNELGSLMNITNFDATTGQFSGTYQTADSLPDKNGVKSIKPDDPWPLFGTASSDVVSFTVNYSHDNEISICTWMGLIIDTKKIRTQWLLGGSVEASKEDKSPKPAWGVTRIGSDIFDRQ